MARSSSVMQQESVDTVWTEAPITVYSDGSCSVDIVIHAARLPSVCNTRENTKVAYPDGALPTSSENRSASLAGLVASEKKVNAKHFIVTRYAKEYLQHLNGNDDPNYTNNLVKKTNLYFAELAKFKNLSSNLSIEIVNPNDQKMCAELSSFQQEILPWFRQLSGEVNIQKTRERYDFAAFNSRVASPEIVVFALKQNDQFLGTITLNLHTTSDALESARLGYLSDLFVAKGLDDNAEFMTQFIGGVFAKISERFPHLNVLTVMAAAGDLQIPIVKCFEHAKKSGLLHSFTRTEQERLGIIAQFTLDSRNAGNMHLPALPLGRLPTLSIANIHTLNGQAKALRDTWNFKKTLESVNIIKKHAAPNKAGCQVVLESGKELLENHEKFKKEQLIPLMEAFVNFAKSAKGLSDIEKNLVVETREILKLIRDKVLSEIKDIKADVNSSGAILAATTLAAPTYNQLSPEIMAASANFRNWLFNNKYKAKLAQSKPTSATNPKTQQERPFR